MNFPSEDAIRQLVDAFERGDIDEPAWNHRAHLAIVSWYLLSFEDAVAVEKTRTGILRFNRLNGIERTPTGGYHETLTLFWLEVVRDFLSALPGSTSVHERVNAVVSAFSHRRELFLEHYRSETIWSWDARIRWVEPDLKPLGASDSQPG